VTEPVPSAADLIEQARLATTEEELDRIYDQADDRITVINAVNDARARLRGETGEQQPENVSPATTEPQVMDVVQPAPVGQSQAPYSQSGEPLSPVVYGGPGLPTVYGEPGAAAPGTDNPGDLGDPLAANQIMQAEQVDPPLGPYPDPPLGPYPDPAEKDPPELDEPVALEERPV
jgi:hypothetical protein